MTYKNWLITGGNGLLGTALKRELEDTSVNFYAPSRDCLDITDDEDIQAAFKEMDSVDLVVHCAAWTDVNGAEKYPAVASYVNTAGTFNIANECYRRRIPMMHISTDYVFGGKPEPRYEWEDPSPINTYGLTKAHAEQAVRNFLPGKHIIVRTGGLYGASKGFISNVVALALAGQTVTVPNHRVYQPTPARGLAAALVKIGKSPNEALELGTVHITAQGSATHYDVAREVVGLMNADVAVEIDWSWCEPARRPAASILVNNNVGVLVGEWKAELRKHLPEVIEYVKGLPS